MGNYEKGSAAQWEDSWLWMRYAQGVSLPMCVTDNPVEFGEIYAEIDKRRLNGQRRLVCLAALLGILGSIVGGVAGALLTFWLSN